MRQSKDNRKGTLTKPQCEQCMAFPSKACWHADADTQFLEYQPTLGYFLPEIFGVHIRNLVGLLSGYLSVCMQNKHVWMTNISW